MSGSFIDIFLNNRKALIWSVMRIVGDHQAAEDVTQEAYMRVSKAVEGGTVEHVEAFLFQTARNIALNHKRSRTVRASVERDDVSDADVETIRAPVPSQEAEIIHRQRLRLLEAAVSGLPERARKVWILSKVEKWPYPRIAKHLGVSPNTVFNDIKMAHAHCMDALAKIDRE